MNKYTYTLVSHCLSNLDSNERYVLQRKGFLMFAITTLVTSLLALTIVISSIDSDSPQKAAAVNEQQTYSFVKKWGSHGTGDGQFQRIHDLDFDPSEKYLYVVDRDGNRIQIFDKNGTFINKWGSKGTGDGEFTIPYSVDVDSQGNVWVADRGNHRVQKFDTNGTFVKSWGALGKGDGQFDLPVSIIMDSKGDLIVNERENNRIQKFDKDGNLLLKFGSTGTDDGQFSEIEHMATDKFDNIFVNDPQSGKTGSGEPRVQKFDSNGNFITKWGSYGKGDGQFVDPEHLAIDSEGNVYVSDRSSNNIQVFKPVDL